MPGAKEVAIPIRNDFDFTDLSALTIAWTLFEDGRSLAQGKAQIVRRLMGWGK
jgi:beta-galactosidase